MAESKQWQEVKGPLGLSLAITALVWLLLFAVVLFDPAGHYSGSKVQHQQEQLLDSATQTVTVSTYTYLLCMQLLAMGVMYM